jgi:hypothetical protein
LQIVDISLVILCLASSISISLKKLVSVSARLNIMMKSWNHVTFRSAEAAVMLNLRIIQTIIQMRELILAEMVETAEAIKTAEE